MPHEYKHFLGKLGLSLPVLLENLGDNTFDAWLLLRWMVQALLISAAVLAADYLTGAGLLSAFRIRVPGRLRLLCSLTLGIALQGLFLLALGLSGLLTQNTVRWGSLLLGLAGLFALWKGGRYVPLDLSVWRPRRWWPILLIAPLVLVFVADLMQPVAEGDSTMYHMAAARWYRDHQALPYHPEIRFNAQPHLSVLLYLRQWLITGEDTLLKLFNLELTLVLVAALLAGLKELRIRQRWLPFVLITSSPVFVWVMKIEYADLALTAFTGAGGVLLIAALRRQSLPLAALAGVALATAGAIKLQGLILAAALLLAFAATAWRAAWPWRRLALALTMACGAIVLWGAGWWIRSWLATGSPAYPFFSNAPDLERLMAVNKTYGFGRDLWAMLLLPWRAMTVRPVHFADTYTFGPALALAVASGVALVWRRRFTPALAFTGGALGIFFLFWFFSGQVMRYWASTLVLQALWIAAGLVVAPPVWLGRWLAAGLTACAALNCAITSPTLLNGWPPPVRLEQKETVQAETLRYYRAARAVNALAGPGERTYAMHSEDARFHLRGPHAGDWFGERSFFWLSYEARSETEVVGRLRQAGYRYVLLDRERGKLRAGMFGFDFLGSEFMRVWGTPPGTVRVYDDGQYAAFRIVP